MVSVAILINPFTDKGLKRIATATPQLIIKEKV